jgi:hypothetical protein
MAVRTALHVNGPSSQLIGEGLDTASTVSTSSSKQFNVKTESLVLPGQVASIEMVKGLGKAKKEKTPDDWNPADFEKDASYFELTFDLPNEGENPYKITDITDEMLSGCFGEKSRSGYKLSNCVGIPIDDVLHLSQIVDGYEKPVNGVLALTFVKGVYAERMQNRKVNWAQYASAKLRGQILQWEREKKGKPDGPPCVRKPRSYRPTRPVLAPSNSRECPIAISTQTISSSGGPRAYTLLETVRPGNDSSILSLERSTNTTMDGGSESEPSSILLQVLQSCILTVKARKAEAVQDAEKIKRGLDLLDSAELDQPTLVANLSKECRCNETELQNIKESILSREKKCEDWQTELELEQNKEGQVRETSFALLQADNMPLNETRDAWGTSLESQSL